MAENLRVASVLGVEEVKKAFKRAFNEDRSGGGWKSFKEDLPEALGRDSLGHLGLLASEPTHQHQLQLRMAGQQLVQGPRTRGTI